MAKVDESTIWKILDEVLDKKLSPIIESLDFLNKEFEGFKNKIQLLEDSNKTVMKENGHLRKQVSELRNEVEQLKTSNDDQEQYSRRECLQIRGVPIAENENIKAITTGIGSLMGLILEVEISVSHKLPTRRNNVSSKFSSPFFVIFLIFVS